jgi:inhibitor of cysteine peptidase
LGVGGVASAIVELVQADSGARRTVRVGEDLVVVLAENPTTGYRWFADVDDALLQALDDSYDGPSEPRGAPGTRQLVFRALREGPARLRLEKKRPWEGRAVEEFVVDLEVVPV